MAKIRGVNRDIPSRAANTGRRRVSPDAQNPGPGNNKPAASPRPYKKKPRERINADMTDRKIKRRPKK